MQARSLFALGRQGSGWPGTSPEKRPPRLPGVYELRSKTSQRSQVTRSLASRVTSAQCEGLDVARAHDSEVPVVDCRDLPQPQAFGDRDDGGVQQSERKVDVPLD